jgi:hypothetical protein
MRGGHYEKVFFSEEKKQKTFTFSAAPKKEALARIFP